MAAITGIVYVGKIPWSNANSGALIAEVWRIPASSAADTQTIVAKFLKKILYIIGPVSFTVLGGANSAALITSVTVAASNFVDILVIGHDTP